MKLRILDAGLYTVNNHLKLAGIPTSISFFSAITSQFGDEEGWLVSGEISQAHSDVWRFRRFVEGHCYYRRKLVRHSCRPYLHLHDNRIWPTNKCTSSCQSHHPTLHIITIILQFIYISVLLSFSPLFQKGVEWREGCSFSSSSSLDVLHQCVSQDGKEEISPRFFSFSMIYALVELNITIDHGGRWCAIDLILGQCRQVWHRLWC